MSASNPSLLLWLTCTLAYIPVSRHTACLVTAWPTMSNINIILRACAHTHTHTHARTHARTHTHAHTHTTVPMKCTSQCHMHNAIMLPSLPPAKGTTLLTVQTLFQTVTQIPDPLCAHKVLYIQLTRDSVCACTVPDVRLQYTEPASVSHNTTLTHATHAYNIGIHIWDHQNLNSNCSWLQSNASISHITHGDDVAEVRLNSASTSDHHHPIILETLVTCTQRLNSLQVSVGVT